MKALALARGLPVLQPDEGPHARLLAELRALAPDLIVVAAYGRILPRTILDLPPHGCINVHASILPRHRGAAPIQHAILAGDAETGVTIMAMSEEMDAGDMLLVRRTPIAPDDTGGSLGERLSQLGAEALARRASTGCSRVRCGPVPQPADGRHVRAAHRARAHAASTGRDPPSSWRGWFARFAPEPSAFTTLDGTTLKVFAAEVRAGSGEPRPSARGRPARARGRDGRRPRSHSSRCSRRASGGCRPPPSSPDAGSRLARASAREPRAADDARGVAHEILVRVETEDAFADVLLAHRLGGRPRSRRSDRGARDRAGLRHARLAGTPRPPPAPGCCTSRSSASIRPFAPRFVSASTSSSSSIACPPTRRSIPAYGSRAGARVVW